MLSKNHVEIKLYELLEPRLTLHGFVALPKLKQFRAMTPTGFQNIILSVSTYPEGALLEVHLGVRIDLIENLAQQFINETALEFREHTNTVIISIGKLTDLQYFRYKIEEDEDIVDTIEQIMDFMQQQGFAFLEYASHLKNIDNIFNTIPNQSVKYLYNQTHRFFKALIAARICNNRDFLKLMDIYGQALLQQYPTDITLNNYEKLANYLLRYSIN